MHPVRLPALVHPAFESTAVGAGDAASALAYDPQHGDTFLTARGRHTVERLLQEEWR
ncbi:hypothetical protein [Streptomyces sp. NPDC001296]